MKKIGVLVSGSGTNLQAVMDHIERGSIKGEISVVISNVEGVYALERAKKNGIFSMVIKKKDYESIDSFCDALADALKEVDLVVMAGFLAILNESFTKRFENRMINIHPSLIPAFCGKGCYGLKVHEKVLDYGVKLTGATVHFVTAEPDAGPVIMQKAVEVLDSDTPEMLQKRVMEQAEQVILPQAVALFCEDKIKVLGRKVIVAS